LDIPDYIKIINELKEGELSHIYILSGDWDFLKEDLISRIFDLLRKKGDTFIVHTESEIDLEKEIKNARNVLIPTTKLIVAKLNSTPKLKVIPDDIYLIIDSNSPIRMSKGKLVKLSPPGPRELEGYIKEHIRGLSRYYDKEIDDTSVNILTLGLAQSPHLLLSIWNTLLLLVGDKKRIEEEDTREVVKNIPVFTGFQVIDMLEKGRITEALFLLRKEYYPDSEIMQLLSMLRKRYKLILSAKVMSPQDLEFAKTFNISVGYARFILSISRDYKMEDLSKKIKLLLSAERRIKTGEVKPKEGLEDFILSLSLSS